MPVSFSLRPESAGAIRWSARGSCGNAGCSDPECCCSLCGLPIGLAQEDPRWEGHYEDCAGCELCRDSYPLTIWRTFAGGRTEEARFHYLCFQKVVRIRSSAG